MAQMYYLQRCHGQICFSLPFLKFINLEEKSIADEAEALFTQPLPGQESRAHMVGCVPLPTVLSGSAGPRRRDALSTGQ